MRKATRRAATHVQLVDPSTRQVMLVEMELTGIKEYEPGCFALGQINVNGVPYHLSMVRPDQIRSRKHPSGIYVVDTDPDFEPCPAIGYAMISPFSWRRQTR